MNENPLLLRLSELNQRIGKLVTETKRLLEQAKKKAAQNQTNKGGEKSGKL